MSYCIDRPNQWISLKKRADKLLFSQACFFNFLKQNEKQMKCIADEQHLTPYVDRKDKMLPYTLENLAVYGKPKKVRSIILRKSSGNVQFSSLRDADRLGFSRRKVVSAIKNGTSYMDGIWEYAEGVGKDC